MPNRRPYPTDVSDEEWAFVAPYLALVRQDASQRTHDLRGLLRLASCREPEPTALAKDYERLPATVAPCPPPGHRRARVRSVTCSRPSARVPMACRTEDPLPVRG
jgi:hypothetical protein